MEDRGDEVDENGNLVDFIDDGEAVASMDEDEGAVPV